VCVCVCVCMYVCIYVAAARSTRPPSGCCSHSAAASILTYALALTHLCIHRRFIYKGDTSTYAQGTALRVWVNPNPNPPVFTDWRYQVHAQGVRPRGHHRYSHPSVRYRYSLSCRVLRCSCCVLVCACASVRALFLFDSMTYFSSCRSAPPSACPRYTTFTPSGIHTIFTPLLFTDRRDRVHAQGVRPRGHRYSLCIHNPPIHVCLCRRVVVPSCVLLFSSCCVFRVNLGLRVNPLTGFSFSCFWYISVPPSACPRCTPLL